MNAKTREAIERHGENLLRIFPNAAETDPLALCRKLRRIETVAHRNAEKFCNGEIDSEEYEKARDKVYVRLNSVLKPGNVPVFVNGDPRGMILKIDDEWVRENRVTIYRNMGGEGLIAPDLTA